MGAEVNTRLLVLEMLLAVTKKENAEYSHVVIRDVQNKYNYLSTKEKAFMKRLFEGTLERMIELDYCIECFSKVKVNKMKPAIRTILRMGTYQILYMDAVPDSAACNESVKLTQKKGFSSLKGFVNGILRNIARNKDNISYPSRETDYERWLSVTYSMPDWIVRMWLSQLGEKTTEELLKSLLLERPVTVRMRTADEQAFDALKTSLEAQGGTLTPSPLLPYAYSLSHTDDMTQLAGYEEGAFAVQDISSMLAIEALGLDRSPADRSLRVLDICAAPGGKTMLAADKLSHVTDYHIEARDISPNKVALMQENFTRCRLTNVQAAAWDALTPDEHWLNSADIVIADLPCSGLGVIGRKRDIKYKLSPEVITDIVTLQESILRIAVTYLKPGGKLLFSTCTINTAENESHARWLATDLGLTPVSLDDTLPPSLHTATTRQGCLQLLPSLHNTDGFFISVFTK